MNDKPNEKPKDEHSRFAVWTRRGTTYIRMPIVVFIVGLLALVTLAVILWSIKRESDAELHVDDIGELSALLPSLVGLTHSNLDEGNRIEVLQNGDELFPPMLLDIAAARYSVHVELFIWYDGKLASDMARALTAKAREGVQVRILVDASGGRQLDGEELKMLEDAGAHVAHFHPLRISNLGRLNNRDHRKLVILDGRIAYTGGFGFADEWLGNAANKKQYRDTSLRIEGPVVNRLQGAFTENWIEETGLIPADDEIFPRLPAVGSTTAHVAYSSPTGSISSVQILYYLAIKAARKEILIQNPYMLPDDQAIAAFAEAVKRGVDVQIMVPSDDATDSPLVQHASHRTFETLMESGVKIWEYDKTLLHQKVLVVDGVWSSVGSTNSDDRSFQLNDEVNISMLDSAIAAELKQAFVADLRHARPVSLEQWRNRPLRHKLLDGVAYLGRSQM